MDRSCFRQRSLAKRFGPARALSSLPRGAHSADYGYAWQDDCPSATRRYSI